MKDLDSYRTNELFSEDKLLAHSERRTSKKKRRNTTALKETKKL
jgi:hypothetical protein